MDLFYVLDGEHSDHNWAMGEVLQEFGAGSVMAPARNIEAQYAVGEYTHLWNEATFDHIARNKDIIIQKAEDEDYDYVIFVDSDLVLEPTTFYSMLRAEGDLVSAVFWTYWDAADERSCGPNVWLRHPYGQEGLGLKGPKFWRRLTERRLTRVAGGGACMLMNRRAIETLRYFPRIENLPDHGMYRGEDRSFCIKAKRNHLGHVADPWPDIYHLYSPTDRTKERTALALEEALQPRQKHPEYGDLVNICLVPLEDPNMLHRRFNVRGRLGQLNLAPQLEHVLPEMVQGEKRIVELKFPDYWDIVGGEDRMVEMELVDTKPFVYAPCRADHMLNGVPMLGAPKEVL